MFDSAIGTDFLSSDDDKSSLHGHTIKEKTLQSSNEQKTPLARPTAKLAFVTAMSSKFSFRHSSWLDKINEKESPLHRPRRSSAVSSTAPSERSLEWFDDLSSNAKQKPIKPCLESEEGTPL